MTAFKPQPVPDPLPEPGGMPQQVNFDALGTATPFGPPPGRFKQFYQNNNGTFGPLF